MLSLRLSVHNVAAALCSTSDVNQSDHRIGSLAKQEALACSDGGVNQRPDAHRPPPPGGGRGSLVEKRVNSKGVETYSTTVVAHFGCKLASHTGVTPV